MYNSVTVAILSRIWYCLEKSYKYSFLKVIIGGICNSFRFLAKGSAVVKFFASNRKMVEESFVYKIYSRLIDFIGKIIDALRLLINKGKKGSIIDWSVSKLFKDQTEILNTACSFMLVFALSIIIVNLARGRFSGRSYIVSFAIIVLSLIGLSTKNNFNEVLENSVMVRFIKGIFSVDEGGNQWW
jgi:hypothetical protein